MLIIPTIKSAKTIFKIKAMHKLKIDIKPLQCTLFILTLQITLFSYGNVWRKANNVGALNGLNTSEHHHQIILDGNRL
jgi:hypothetical protein